MKGLAEKFKTLMSAYVKTIFGYRGLALCALLSGICVRGGLHCAPLVHREQGTSFQGAVRASVGCETKEGEIAYFLSVVERLAKGLKS